MQSMNKKTRVYASGKGQVFIAHKHVDLFLIKNNVLINLAKTCYILHAMYLRYSSSFLLKCVHQTYKSGSYAACCLELCYAL